MDGEYIINSVFLSLDKHLQCFEDIKIATKHTNLISHFPQVSYYYPLGNYRYILRVREIIL